MNALSHLTALLSRVTEECCQPGRSLNEVAESAELYRRLARLAAQIHDAQGQEPELRQLEALQGRPLAHAARRYVLRKHATLALPEWGSGGATTDPNLVFFSGPQNLRDALQSVADDAGLRLDPDRRQSEAGLAILDISAGDLQVFHELGVALATGMALLIVARLGTEVPFDVAREVRFYGDEHDLVDFLALETSAALYGVPPAEDGSSVDATIEYAAHVAEDRGDLLRALRDEAQDPIAFRTAAQAFAEHLSPPATLLYPKWPGAYAVEPRCFILVPADATYEAVAGECEEAGVEPVRGDGWSIHAIWRGVCRATHVVVNADRIACLALGMADTLGKKSLLIDSDAAALEDFLRDSPGG